MDNGCLTPPLSPWQAGTNQLRNYIICSGDTRGVAGTKWRSSLASRERIAHLDLAAWLQDRARTVSGRDQREKAREFGQMADHLGGSLAEGACGQRITGRKLRESLAGAVDWRDPRQSRCFYWGSGVAACWCCQDGKTPQWRPVEEHVQYLRCQNPSLLNKNHRQWRRARPRQPLDVYASAASTLDRSYSV